MMLLLYNAAGSWGTVPGFRLTAKEPQTLRHARQPADFRRTPNVKLTDSSPATVRRQTDNINNRITLNK